MATKKAAGSTKNLSDSNPKYLGTKLYAGQNAQPGSVIVRQRGTRILPGRNVGMGRDHTLFSRDAGVVSFRTRRKRRFDGKTVIKRVVEVLPQS